MAQDRHLKEAYITLITSLLPNMLIFVSWVVDQTREGVSCALIIMGIGWILSSRRRIGTIIMGAIVILFGIGLGIPVSGLVLPFHPILLRLYSPTTQFLSHHLAITALLIIFTRNIFTIITLKQEQWNKLRREEIARQEKMKGIFYTPTKSRGPTTERSITARNVARGGTRERNGFGYMKPRNVFTLS